MKQYTLYWLIPFLLFFIAGSKPLTAQGSSSLYVGQSCVFAPPTPPGNSALSQTAWGCTHPSVSVQQYMNLGGQVTVNSYFTGAAQVFCDYYYFWYDSYGYMHTNNSRAYYTVTCNAVTLTINPTSIQMNVGESQTISYSLSPNITPTPTIHFISNNTNVITTNSNGRIYAEGPGSTTITVENSAGPNATCSVTVIDVSPTDIYLPNSMTLTVGETQTIAPTVLPPNAVYTLSWLSSDTSVATVTPSGGVTGRSPGIARITARVNGYSLSDYCDVTIEQPRLSLSAQPEGGLLETGAMVILSASDTNASIYFTLDGSTPDQNCPLYTSPISISQDLTLKAIAYHTGYNASDILTANYQVTSLKAVSSFPENNASNLGRNIIPSVTFNSDILQGENFNEIRLIKNAESEVSGEMIYSGSSLYFIPDEDLPGGNYQLSLPQNCVKNNTLQGNVSYSLFFEILPRDGKYTIKVGKYRILMSNGDLYAWGMSGSAAVFASDVFNYPDPTLPLSLSPFIIFSNIKDFTSGGYGTGNKYILRKDGILEGWGGNYNSESQTNSCPSCNILGDGTMTMRSRPVTIMTGVKTICGGGWHHGVLKEDNSLWMWGRNNYGQVGNGETSEIGQLSPVQILDDVKMASINGYSTIALKNDGSLWFWGSASFMNSGTHISSPTQKMADVQSFSCGDNHFIALKNDGTVWSFGKNNYGQVGNNSTFDHWAPVQILSDAMCVRASSNYSLVLKNDGTLWAFGANNVGQLGDGTNTNRSTPVQVLSNVSFVKTISNNSIAIKDDKSLWRWGQGCNKHADASEHNWTYPKMILNNVVKAINDNNNCFALKEDGSLWGTGSNNTGILGNGTRITDSSMIQIIDSVVDFWHNSGIYVLRMDGSLWGWGNTYIGDGTTSLTLSPVKIMNGATPSVLEMVEIVVDSIRATHLPVGERLVLQSLLTPLNGSYDTLIWSISEDNIVSISQRGVVTALSPGTTEVQLEVQTDEETFTCSQSITVVETESIENISTTNYNIFISHSNLYLEKLEKGAQISLYTIDGTMVFDGVSKEENMCISLKQKGVYIVKIGNYTTKVLNI